MRDNELLLRLVANLNMLLKDESVNVVKKAILTLTQLYKVTLQVRDHRDWACARRWTALVRCRCFGRAMFRQMVIATHARNCKMYFYIYMVFIFDTFSCCSLCMYTFFMNYNHALGVRQSLPWHLKKNHRIGCLPSVCHSQWFGPS